MKSSYLISCAVGALLAGGIATTAAAADAPPADNSSSAAAAQAAASNGSNGSNVIIVTAERRSQNVERVPATIQAFTGQSLQQANITTLDDLLKFTPNITFGNNGAGQGEIFMRGLSAGFRGGQSSATIANFPNVAIYLDEESMQFPARNVDIYMADMQRIEVLEGPQGTLFGGGAEAGAVRYITNKPDVSATSAHVEASYGWTSHGDPNDSINATLNVPIVPDRFAVRAVIYNERQGGYIDNVPSSFTRSNSDLGNTYFNIHPVAGLCPNGLPGGGPHNLCTLPNQPQFNNFAIAGSASNPTTWTGARFEAQYDINEDWNVLVTESLQNLDAQGIAADYPIGSNFQPLGPLQITAFTPSFDHDKFENTAWTVNGKIGPLKAIYTGSYLTRNIDDQMDYANYSRTTGGMYYQCTGGATGFGGHEQCFSPLGYWRDKVRNTHLSNEFRLSTPDDWRFRAIAGVFNEQFRVYDVMNFNYKSIPSCTPANLAAALVPGGPPCLANVRPAPGSTTNDPSIRGDNTAFGEDTQRGYDQTAIFASFDFDIIPDVLTVTAGTRWYQYNEFEVGSQYETTTECLDVPNGQCGPNSDKNINAHHDQVTYTGFKSRASITWRITPDTMVYALFSQGFRPGGFNRAAGLVAPGPGPGSPDQFNKPNGYAPDTITNYEAGLKTELFDHRLQVNFSAYYMNWDNVQFLFFNPTELGNTTFGVNGPNYRVEGAELQVVARPIDGLTIQGSVTYNNDQQTSSPCLKDNVPGTAAFGQCITQVVQSGVGLVPFQNPFGTIGSVPAFSPYWQGNIRARYDWTVGDYKPYVTGGASYMGSMFNQPGTYESGAGVLIPNTTFLRYEQPAYTLFDASIGVRKDNWYAELYSQNIGDSHASMFTSSAQFIKSEVPVRPRIIMIKVSADF
ncbi:MAG TPA: TonB-dependent receptor [Caulobacteraceae bacterium]|nr:TonB-dependent receptor [Caulobacteraceae bacterium]